MDRHRNKTDTLQLSEISREPSEHYSDNEF